MYLAEFRKIGEAAFMHSVFTWYIPSLTSLVLAVQLYLCANRRVWSFSFVESRELVKTNQFIGISIFSCRGTSVMFTSH